MDLNIARHTGHDPVHHPSHYCSHPSGIECIEITRLLSFDTGNAVKYVWRRGEKGNPVQDLDKSLFYLDDARDRAPHQRHVTRRARKLLLRAANTEPDPLTAVFYRAVADQRWEAAESAVRDMRSALSLAATSPCLSATAGAT